MLTLKNVKAVCVVVWRKELIYQDLAVGLNFLDNQGVSVFFIHKGELRALVTFLNDYNIALMIVHTYFKGNQALRSVHLTKLP